MNLTYPPPTSTRWTLWQYCDIESDVNPGQVYLRRLRLVQTPWFGVYLHWINESDTDRDLHDHPWRFWSLILRGGYTETVSDHPGAPPVSRYWPRWSWHHMPLRSAHRIIALVDETVTLVIVGRRVRVWGFWTTEGRIPWPDYLRNHRHGSDASGETL
jgi:hypothetical protein